MQPAYVGDVATAIADAVDGKTRAGATYELGGPEVLTMREIMEIILQMTGRDRTLVSLPFGMARFQAAFLQFAPGALKLTPDQVAMLQSDNVVSDAAKAAGLTFEGLGITPDSMEAILPQYLWRFRASGQFQLDCRTFPHREEARQLRLRMRSDGYFPSASAIRPRVPTITRHHAKNVKPWRAT
jgi:NADH dehydrogenase